ncbi:tRNA (adenosine(37)-N6)-threonylcarbamoyltransferase complex transferase subunit TsaD [Verrucomicrobiales bacterium]|nr:tRNA (adenosine(37)-N6)-threonylcarbamoyltransferase complex transferase subunit TsaD [Verrucomicrobiales bacterium]
MILALESSCDETAAAVLSPPSNLLSSIVSSQAKEHEPYGGVVPELASRNHLVLLRPTVEKALASANVTFDKIEAFAATSGPGLSSSLLIGNTAAKALSLSSQKPFIAINHMEGHLCSPFLDMEIKPHIGLIVSGGHTLLVKVKQFDDYKVVGNSLDDAAGEAFDKVGKMLGLSYPGGPEVEKSALKGDSKRFNFPRSMLNSGNLNFSFSGIKTSVLYKLKEIGVPDKQTISDLCASFQAAVIEILVTKALNAAKLYNLPRIALSGGVACNGSLRDLIKKKASEGGVELFIVDKNYSTDNAAMIARAASERFIRKQFSSLESDVNPNLEI